MNYKNVICKFYDSVFLDYIYFAHWEIPPGTFTCQYNGCLIKQFKRFSETFSFYECRICLMMLTCAEKDAGSFHPHWWTEWRKVRWTQQSKEFKAQINRYQLLVFIIIALLLSHHPKGLPLVTWGSIKLDSLKCFSPLFPCPHAKSHHLRNHLELEWPTL